MPVTNDVTGFERSRREKSRREPPKKSGEKGKGKDENAKNAAPVKATATKKE